MSRSCYENRTLNPDVRYDDSVRTPSCFLAIKVDKVIAKDLNPFHQRSLFLLWMKLAQ